jgi:hypothetical protein
VASKAVTRALSQALFADAESNVYAILDGAAVPDLLNELYRMDPAYECLYRGELEPDLAWVAPYLVHLEPDAPFTRFVLEQGWGGSWGIFATSNARFDEVRRHFRRFLMVHTSEGKPLYFRYYDPRVLREFLPIADAEQIKTMFDLLKAYFAEGPEGAVLLRFEAQDGAVGMRELDLKTAAAR